MELLELNPTPALPPQDQMTKNRMTIEQLLQINPDEAMVITLKFHFFSFLEIS